MIRIRSSNFRLSFDFCLFSGSIRFINGGLSNDDYGFWFDGMIVSDLISFLDRSDSLMSIGDLSFALIVDWPIDFALSVMFLIKRFDSRLFEGNHFRLFSCKRISNFMLLLIAIFNHLLNNTSI